MEGAGGPPDGFSWRPDGTVFIQAEHAWQRMVLAGKGPVVVLFTSRFCGACRTLDKVYPAMKKAVKEDVTFAVVDINESERSICAQALGPIGFVPVVQIYSEGDRKDYFAAGDEAALREKLLNQACTSPKTSKSSAATPVGCCAFLKSLFH
uniref:Thioredoxin domain-containing protein n=1 Tax=Alexandrium catenella TaxID=2925 RepID=A0A7S1WSF2_ALECA